MELQKLILHCQSTTYQCCFDEQSSILGSAAQVYILPKALLTEIIKVCRAFLWSGHFYSQKLGLVAWDELCCSKKEGGLGFRDIVLWNLANMRRYVWALAKKKQDNAWIRWVNSVYLHEHSWWDYKYRLGASRYGKKICATKDKLKQFFTLEEMEAMNTYSVKLVYNKLTQQHNQATGIISHGTGYPCESTDFIC